MIVKVCGMREAENIRQVEQTGADWMGFIDYEGSPRYVADVPTIFAETVRWVVCQCFPSANPGKEDCMATEFRPAPRKGIAGVLPGSATDWPTCHQGLLPAYA